MQSVNIQFQEMTIKYNQLRKFFRVRNFIKDTRQVLINSTKGFVR